MQCSIYTAQLSNYYVQLNVKMPLSITSVLVMQVVSDNYNKPSKNLLQNYSKYIYICRSWTEWQ